MEASNQVSNADMNTALMRYLGPKHPLPMQRTGKNIILPEYPLNYKLISV